MTSLTRNILENAFTIAGQYLRDRRTLGEISVYGGSAIMLQFDWREATADVDAVIIAGNHGVVRDAFDEAARRLSLPRSWLNESVSVYRLPTETQDDVLPIGMYPSYENPGLRVMAATPKYLFVMKLMAMERSTHDDRDFQDAANLGAELGLASIDQIREMAHAHIGKASLPETASLRLDSLYAAIEDKRAGVRKVR